MGKYAVRGFMATVEVVLNGSQTPRLPTSRRRRIGIPAVRYRLGTRSSLVPLLLRPLLGSSPGPSQPRQQNDGSRQLNTALPGANLPIAGSSVTGTGPSNVPSND